MSPRLLYGWCQSIYKKITAEKNEKGFLTLPDLWGDRHMRKGCKADL